MPLTVARDQHFRPEFRALRYAAISPSKPARLGPKKLWPEHAIAFGKCWVGRKQSPEHIAKRTAAANATRAAKRLQRGGDHV